MVLLCGEQNYKLNEMNDIILTNNLVIINFIIRLTCRYSCGFFFLFKSMF